MQLYRIIVKQIDLNHGIMKGSFANNKMPKQTYAPAEGGPFQSAQCPHAHSPQTLLVSGISQQPLIEIKCWVHTFILKTMYLQLKIKTLKILSAHNLVWKKQCWLLPWTNTLSISTMSVTASPLTAQTNERGSTVWLTKRGKKQNIGNELKLFNSRLVLSSLKDDDRSLLTVSCTVEKFVPWGHIQETLDYFHSYFHFIEGCLTPNSLRKKRRFTTFYFESDVATLVV